VNFNGETMFVYLNGTTVQLNQAITAEQICQSI